MTLSEMSDDKDLRLLHQRSVMSAESPQMSPSKSPEPLIERVCAPSRSRSNSPVSYATDLSISTARTSSPNAGSHRMHSPTVIGPLRGMSIDNIDGLRRPSPLQELPRTSPISRITNPLLRSPVRHHQGHQSASTKCSNFSINSILSKSSNSSKESSPSPSSRTSPPASPDKSDRPSLGHLHPHETLMKMDVAHMNNLAAAAAAFHPGLNPAFLERALPGGLPGKPTPWYPWFAAAAGAYLPFPFDSSKYLDFFFLCNYIFKLLL